MQCAMDEVSKKGQDLGGEKVRILLPKLKLPGRFRKNHKQKNNDADVDKPLNVEEPEQPESLEEISRTLILREERLFAQEFPAEEEQEQLHRDFDDLLEKILAAADTTFNASSTEDLKVLQSAVVSIHQQEAQDRRWTDHPRDRVPAWRPQKCLGAHNTLLAEMVDSRLMRAAEDEGSDADGPSSPLRKRVCNVGKQLKKDLLTVARNVMGCYPPEMDILNVYAGFYQRSFSAWLTKLTSSAPAAEDLGYLLFWINTCYPQDVLQHEALQGKIKTACLGSLLPQADVHLLEDQYLSHRADKVSSWLQAALRNEKENWLSGRKPELLDKFVFSPLAVDVIEIISGSLAECSYSIRDQSKLQRITAHLEIFLTRYNQSLEQFVKDNKGDVLSVVKAHLMCEEQLRDYIINQKESLSDLQRRRCLDALADLKACGFGCFIPPIHRNLKVCYKQLWTPGWLDGSLPVVDSLLEILYKQLTDLTDLKPSCRQSLLSTLHQDLVLQHVKRMLKTRVKGKEKEVVGARRMIDDAEKINSFFSQAGCSESSWLPSVLPGLAEVLRLQDPESLHLEMVTLVKKFPDLNDTHVSALLSLKAGLSTDDVRSIRRSVEESRSLHDSTDQSPDIFSRVKVKWINKKMNQMGLKS